jgi:hypothetical protein
LTVNLDTFLPEFVTDAKYLFDSKSLDESTILNTVKDITKRYAYLIELQEAQFHAARPGDIIYYNPSYNPSQYRFGHIETITGSSLVSMDDSDTELQLFRDHPNNNGFIEVSMVVDKKDDDESVYRIRYIGNMASLIQATAAFLTKLFIEREAIDYGGICTLLLSQCAEMDQSDRDARVERLRRTFDKIFKEKKAMAVCSGFTILAYQLAFLIHGNRVYLDKALPYKAEACRPSHIYNNLSKNPLWEVTQFKKILKPFALKASGDVSTLFSSRVKGFTPAEEDPFAGINLRYNESVNGN